MRAALPFLLRSPGRVKDGEQRPGAMPGPPAPYWQGAACQSWAPETYGSERSISKLVVAPLPDFEAYEEVAVVGPLEHAINGGLVV